MLFKEISVKLAQDWKDYVVLATGNGEKLEKWGNYCLLRPDPQVIWHSEKPLARTKGLDAHYIRESTGGGHWNYIKKIPEEWEISWKNIKFSIKPMGFKHTGLFPEQAVNWQDMANLIKILKRNDYIGEVVKEDNVYKVVYQDDETDVVKEIILDEVYPLGSRILIDGMTGDIKGIVGHKDEPNIKTKEVLVEHGFHIEFPEDYKLQLELVPSYLTEDVINNEKRNGRLDQRAIPYITIDGDDTKDFDDAVCFYNGVLYVAIADVPYFIEEDSPIDKETIARSISVYTPGNVEPMLDHKFSSGICSLIPGEDRFTTSLMAKLDDDNAVKSYRLCESIINSKMRMTYSQVNLFLVKGIVPSGYENYVGMLTKLYDVAMSMKKQMLKDGFLEFSSTEVQVYL